MAKETIMKSIVSFWVWIRHVINIRTLVAGGIGIRTRPSRRERGLYFIVEGRMALLGLAGG